MKGKLPLWSRRIPGQSGLANREGGDAIASGEPTNKAAGSRRRMRVGLSACLLGERIRYDGGHKWNRLVVDCLARYFELVPVCPGVAIGLGTPREPVRLAGAPESPRAIGIQNESLDATPEAPVSQAKAELVDHIHAYRQGLVPLSVPATLLRHHFQRHHEPSIDKQLYLTWQPTRPPSLLSFPESRSE
ncbi:MAG: DUF523 and DUF1722 domain-containing protein [Nitrococcus sp.]|nr:DUF523 and DUF1722 domain-containing protein [Nitrococcus sp.]